MALLLGAGIDALSPGTPSPTAQGLGFASDGKASLGSGKASLGSDLNGINFSVSHCVAVMNHAMTSCR